MWVQNTLSHNAHGNIVLLEEAASELIGNVISHGPLGGIIIRGNTTVPLPYSPPPPMSADTRALARARAPT